MKSFAFAAVIGIAAAAELEWHQQRYVPVKHVHHTPGHQDKAASYNKGAENWKKTASDWDAWGRDQDLSINESYGKTNAKSYSAESYDEWDNEDNDKWGAQAWGQDQDKYGASSKWAGASSGWHGDYAAAKSTGKGHGHGWGHNPNGHYGSKSTDKTKASEADSAAQGGYDNDAWAKQAYGSDYDSRWGKSYDSVAAKSYDNEHYAKSVRADDDQWAEDYDKWAKTDDGAYGSAASDHWSSTHGHGHGWNKKGGVSKDAASKHGAAGAWSKDGSDWDSWGRDQDYAEDVSYDKTWAKSYAAESYDEWDNSDADKWGAQAWGSDQDVYGSSSYGKAASSKKTDWAGAGGQYGQSYGGHAGGHHAGHAGYGKSHGGHGWGKGGHGHAHGGHAAGYGKSYGGQQNYGSYGHADTVWKGASKASAQAKAGYDNDAWAKQAYGSDADSRWGKSYDNVSAKSYANESFARDVKADDDQWGEDYDRWTNEDDYEYANGASKEAVNGKHGKGWAAGWNKGPDSSAAASKNYGMMWDGASGSDWDAWGRDQDLKISESYDKTWAKSYDAESYDEWDNNDDDKWGAQSWGRDQDKYAASSHANMASAGDWDDYSKAGAYGGKQYANMYGHNQAYGGYGHGGHGGWGGAHGAHGAHGHAAGYGKAGAKSYSGKAGSYGNEMDKEASKGSAAAKGGYDNDAWAKQAYGVDTDSRWGKSYDSVAAKSYDNEEYARKVQADDDQWAEDYDRWTAKDKKGYGNAASAGAYTAPRQSVSYSYAPVHHGHHGHGHGHGHAGHGGHGYGYGGAHGW